MCFDCRVVCLSACQCRQQAVYEVNSPQYPQPYAPNLLKRWHLLAPAGFLIQVRLTHLDIKASPGCSLDSLTVRATGFYTLMKTQSSLQVLTAGGNYTFMFLISD